MDLTFGSYVTLYLIAAAVFLLLDLLWLGVVAKDFYRNNLGSMLAKDFRGNWAVIFYFLYLIGVLYFAVVPAVNETKPLMAVMDGFLFGFFCYATYDFTNAATLKKWSTKVLWVDLVWGSTVTMTVAGLTYGIYTGLFA